MDTGIELRSQAVPQPVISTVATRAGEKLRVFVSYSRDDSDFAGQLFHALQACGFEPKMDLHELTGGEEFRNRLSTLIFEADTVVFVLTPSSAISANVAWELDQTARFSKRLIPVVAKPLGDAVPPAQLSALDYIFFYPEPKVKDSGFGYGLARLVVALNTDLDWVCQHSRLGMLAARWEEAQQAPNRLLSGPDIAGARAWINRHLKPEPTELHRSFIVASEAAEQARITREKAQDIATRDGEIRRVKAEQEAQRLVLESAKLKAEQAAAVAEAGRRRMQIYLGVPVVLLLAGGGALLWVYDGQRRDAVTARAQLDAANARAEVAEKDKRLAERDKQNAVIQAELERLKQERVAIGPQAKPADEIAAAQLTQSTQTRLTADEVSKRISPEALALIISAEIGSKRDYEEKYRHPEWPGGGSGVVIGFGYDIGYVTVEKFRQNWQSLLPPHIVDRLAEAVGLQGEAARQKLEKIKDMIIPWDAAQQVFMIVTVAEYGAATDKAFANTKDLSPNAFGALVSLVYNRGVGFEGDKRVEMRNIRDLMAQRKFEGIPKELRAMKQLWVGKFAGLVKRREDEAKLFERGLAAGKT